MVKRKQLWLVLIAGILGVSHFQLLNAEVVVVQTEEEYVVDDPYYDPYYQPSVVVVDQPATVQYVDRSTYLEALVATIGLTVVVYALINYPPVLVIPSWQPRVVVAASRGQTRYHRKKIETHIR